MSTPVNNPILARLNNPTIADNLPSSFTNVQGKNLISLRVINSSSLSASQFGNLNGSYSNNQLAFTEWGSLVDSSDPTDAAFQYFISPFDPGYATGTITPPNSGDVINGSDSARIFGNIGAFPSDNPMFSSGQAFVSPKNAKWILSIDQDSSNSNVYTIYFNPLNNSTLSATDIQNNIGKYCDIVNNIDPMCFCQASAEICTQAAFPNIGSASDLKNKSQSDYDAIKTNCNCLNAQCQFAANNEKNAYAAGKVCTNGASACGTSFTYSLTNGISNSDNKTVQEQCGGGGSTNYTTTPQYTTPEAQIVAKKAAAKKEAAKKEAAKKSNLERNIGISVGVVAFIAVIYYLLTQ